MRFGRLSSQMAWTKSNAIAMNKPVRNGLRKRLNLINGGSLVNNGDKDSTSDSQQTLQLRDQ